MGADTMHDGTTISAMEWEARSRWAAWAADIAAGRPWPPPLDILRTAAVLGVDHAGVAIEDDAGAITQASQIEEKLAAIRAESSRLSALARRMTKGSKRIVAELAELRARHPRIWPQLEHDAAGE